MGTRSEILADLSAEVLGPRAGAAELIAEDPRTEYITGVLRPAPPTLHHAVPEDIEEILPAEGDEGDDGEDDDDPPSLGTFASSPSLDPTQLPRSVGLSFTVQGDHPSIRICCTWARYLPTDATGWRRSAIGFTTDWMLGEGNKRVQGPEDVEVSVYATVLPDHSVKVSVYLVNTRVQTELSRTSPEEHVFQPEIRVRLGRGTSMVPLDERGSSTADPNGSAGEEERLALLYAGRQVFSRGHMCGATWASVDPQRDAGDRERERPNRHPFAWTDAGAVPLGERETFALADVRTEFVPCYSVESPETTWSSDIYGPSPVFSATELSEIWEPSQVEAALRPLATAYTRWLDVQSTSSEELDAPKRAAAAANIAQCRRLAQRVERSIELLRTDTDVRLAFCFANKAMALQGRWARGRSLEWRPFQLAFLLAAISSVANPRDPDRESCDLLWFPTGGGKTEAYLGLAAFTMSYRRLRYEDGAGTSVLSRYTLRLLTIQQFRRALAMVTACEKLRVSGLETPGSQVGWRPKGCDSAATFLWGTERFSAGLWVGGGVTPNRLESFPARIDNQIHRFVGALEQLQGARVGYDGPDQSLVTALRRQHLHVNGEPAQVTQCPCCRQSLAVSDGRDGNGGLSEGIHDIHVPHSTGQVISFAASQVNVPVAGVRLLSLQTVALADAYVTTIRVEVLQGSRLSGSQLDHWWHDDVGPYVGAGTLMCARPSRSGYVLVRRGASNSSVVGFELFCPNPVCELNNAGWAETTPVLRSASTVATGGDRSFRSPNHAHLPNTPDHWQDPPLIQGRLSARVLSRVPIPAYTVDDQVYSRCPSFIVATADKFARLAFEPRAASVFGNVSHYHSRIGYYRSGAWPVDGQQPTFRPHPPGGAGGHGALHVPVNRFRPPELIIQDELHLIEGPLGSMVGIYETAIDELCTIYQNAGPPLRPKYVASTATIRQAEGQVRALFDRELAQFPPQAIDIDDSFFALSSEPHQMDEDRAGRLYVGLAAPGRGAQTPIVRIWSRLLQSGTSCRSVPPSTREDEFWTLAAYFNAVRELAGAATLYRQDIPERMRFQYGAGARATDPESYMELSSRVDSMELPSRLEALDRPGGIDVVCATSMFGTGVDVDRLGLMVVHGQPKTTATYIQATGRVGRRSGALVVTFLRAARPRDLDHYEYFVGYHRGLYRYVEPITVSPFAPKARDRCLGALATVLLRQAALIGGERVHDDWRIEQRIANRQWHSEARRMASHRRDAEVLAAIALMEGRAQVQPESLRPSSNATAIDAQAELDSWQRLARLAQTRNDFVYSEPAMFALPVRSVVLGDPQHEAAQLGEAFENAPQSLREIEETTTFKT